MNPRKLLPTPGQVLGVATLCAALAVVLLLLAPDHDAATRAAARTRHVGAPGMRGSTSGKLHAGHPTGRGPAASNLPLTVVMLTPHARARPVPASFLGISTEYWSLPLFERQPGLFERALSLVRTRGDGPLLIRVGGDSADHTFWGLERRTVPKWVVRLGPPTLSELESLINQLGVRLILDLNLVTDTPLTAVRWAAAAVAHLPKGSIAGFEVGNEPDLYRRRYWNSAILHPLRASVLPKDITPASYARDFLAYSTIVSQVAPGVPLVGPAVANPASNHAWISTLLVFPHPGLRVISGHTYPYSACARPRSALNPTISRVLSENGTAGIADRLEPAIRLAHRAGLPFRMTELNSVTCGGRRGVSDTFATTLWASDALFELLRAGVDGVNVHVRAHAINAAFSINSWGMTAHPLLYGLMLFARTLGPGARLTSVHVQLPRRPSPAPHLKVWAVRVAGGGLHVLIIDKGDLPARVDLRLPASGPATVERLLAPSVQSRSGVTMAGQYVGRDAMWHGSPETQTVWPGSRGYVVTVPRMSAALVGMHLASAVTRSRPDHHSSKASGAP